MTKMHKNNFDLFNDGLIQGRTIRDTMSGHTMSSYTMWHTSNNVVKNMISGTKNKRRS